MRALWILVAAVGCSDGAATPDAAAPDAFEGPFAYDFSVGWNEPGTVPHLEPKPAIFIDGVATQSLHLDFPRARDAIGHQIHIELRYGDLVMDAATVTVGDCLDQMPSATTGVEGMCAQSSGDLRPGGVSVEGPGGFCVGDGFCWPRCNPWDFPGCVNAATPRCTSIYASVDPIATHLDCAPAGSQHEGEPCTLVTDMSGTHDNCADDTLLCVGGTCRATCNPKYPSPTCACSYVLGHAPELGVCN